MGWPWKRKQQDWQVCGEIWVPGNIPLPDKMGELSVEWMHVSLSKQHVALLTVMSEGNQVYRRYVHTECDLVLPRALIVSAGSQVWIGTGPHGHVEPESISATLTITGKSRGG